MDRYLKKYIETDLPSKIVLLTGARQCGKTTLAKQISNEYEYFNYDSGEDRSALRKKSWDRKKHLIIFDELHKMKEWKRWLKGIYDTENLPPSILVTGSAQLNAYKKVGDSLAGRYFQYRLHPLDVKEACEYGEMNAEEAFNRLYHCSGFPEPFLKDNQEYYKRWRRSHLDIILRQDLIDLYAVRDIQALETLVLLLKNRVGSTVSYANLARELERDANTVKRWLLLLESLYIIFRVTPYHKKVSRSILKEPKFYFYDCAQVEGEKGARLENILACALFKELQFKEDTTGENRGLHYLRNKDGKEIDFLITVNNKPSYLIEAKWSDDEPSPSFNHFKSFFPEAKQIQLVKELKREATYPTGLEVRAIIPWLSQLNLIIPCGLKQASKDE